MDIWHYSKHDSVGHSFEGRLPSDHLYLSDKVSSDIMPFKPGNKLSPGRKKGIPNRKTQAAQDIIEKALGQSIPDALIEVLGKVDEKTQAHVLCELMQYAYPKRKAIEVEDVTKDRVELKFSLGWNDKNEAKALPSSDALEDSSAEKDK